MWIRGTIQFCSCYFCALYEATHPPHRWFIPAQIMYMAMKWVFFLFCSCVLKLMLILQPKIVRIVAQKLIWLHTNYYIIIFDFPFNLVDLQFVFLFFSECVLRWYSWRVCATVVWRMEPVDDRVFHIDSIQLSQLSDNYVGNVLDRSQTPLVSGNFMNAVVPMSGSAQYHNRRKYTPQVHADYQ